MVAGGNKLVDYSFSEDEFDSINECVSLEESSLEIFYTVEILLPANFTIEQQPSIEIPSPQPNRDLETPPSSAPTSPPTAPSSARARCKVVRTALSAVAVGGVAFPGARLAQSSVLNHVKQFQIAVQ